MTTMPGDDADRSPHDLEGAGTMLAAWLTRTPGRNLSGVLQEVTDRDGRITTLGPSHTYRVGELIGQGGQAAVAAVTPVGLPDHGPLVARVELNPHDPREWRRRELLLFLAHLSRVTPATYPALIRVTESFLTYAHPSDLHGEQRYDSHAGNEPLWVDVMERCTTLADHLRDTHPNGYDPRDGAKLAVPLLRTLGVLHDRYHLVHRDLDEGNILVAPDGTLRIADWGVVVPMSGENPYTYTVPFGKRHTMPPESRDGDQKVGHHTDAWQAGRLLGLILTGTSPFLNDGVTLNSPRLAALPRDLRAVIEGLTDPHVGARLGTFDAAALLEKYIGHPVTPVAGSAPGRGRRNALIGAAVLALVAVGGTIAALDWPGGEEGPGSTPVGAPTSPTTTAVTIQPVLLTDGTLQAIGSASGVVCSFSAPGDGQTATCYVPAPEYTSYGIGESGPADETCPEALEATIPYPAEFRTSCVPHEEQTAPALAAGSTNSFNGYDCTVEDDSIRCTMDDGSGNGFRIGHAAFATFERQRILSLAYTELVRVGTPVWELSPDGAAAVTLPLLDNFYGFDPYTRRILHATAYSTFTGQGSGPAGLAAGDLLITDLDEGTVEEVLPSGVVEARWAPGYEDIAYIVTTPETHELRWRTAGGEDRLLARDVAITWSISPRGDAVAFTREPVYGLSEEAGLFVVPVAGGTEVKVSDADRGGTGSIYDQPVWSPDGSWVALQYFVDETVGYQISLARTDGSGATDLSLDPTLAGEPWATTCFFEPFYWVDDQIIGQSCFLQPEGNPLVGFEIDPESATLTSGTPLANIDGIIGWDIPGESLWVYPTDSRTPELLSLP